MLTSLEGRNIAGQVLIDTFGREYLRANIDRLDFVESLENGILTVYFGIFEHPIRKINVEKDGGILVKEDTFPDTLLNVAVNLRDGTSRIVEE